MTWMPDYVTPEVLQGYLHIEDNSDAALIAMWITTASRNVDDFCGRQFGQVAAPEARYYTPTYDRYEARWYVEMDDLQDATGMTIVDETGTATATTDIKLWPRNAASTGKPYERFSFGGIGSSWVGRLSLVGCQPVVHPEVTVTAKWGWTAVPAAVSTGLLLQAARLSARRDSPFGISGSPQEQGEIRLLAQLDPDFKTALTPLQRKWWAR